MYCRINNFASLPEPQRTHCYNRIIMVGEPQQFSDSICDAEICIVLRKTWDSMLTRERVDRNNSVSHSRLASSERHPANFHGQPIQPNTALNHEGDSGRSNSMPVSISAIYWERLILSGKDCIFSRDCLWNLANAR